MSAACDIFNAKVSGTFKRLCGFFFFLNIVCMFRFLLKDIYCHSFCFVSLFFSSPFSIIYWSMVCMIDNRSQLTQGRKVLLTLDMISKMVHRVNIFSRANNYWLDGSYWCNLTFYIYIEKKKENVNPECLLLVLVIFYLTPISQLYNCVVHVTQFF